MFLFKPSLLFQKIILKSSETKYVGTCMCNELSFLIIIWPTEFQKLLKVTSKKRFKLFPGYFPVYFQEVFKTQRLNRAPQGK